MKPKTINAARVWKQFEDLLAPKLNFSRTDRVIYSHLLRHSRLEGKLKFRFSIAWLARGVRLSMKATRGSVRCLVARGVLDLVERNCRSQHVVRVRLPLEVKAVRAPKTAPVPSAKAVIDIEEADFVEKQILRRSLHDLLYAADRAKELVSGPCCATGARRKQFVPQPGVLLCGMQFGKGRAPS